MNDNGIIERANSPHISYLSKMICTRNGNKDYVFISYKSDDWKKVFEDIIYTLVYEYHLNIYFDASFDEHNETWIEQFTANMNDEHCKGVLAFISEKYLSSYATLMELMHAKTYSAGGEKGLPIVPVNLESTSTLENCKNILSLNEKEKEQFDIDFEKLANTETYSQFKIKYSIKEPLTVSHSSVLINLILGENYQTNFYMDGKKLDYFEKLTKKIRNTFGNTVFSYFDPTNQANVPKVKVNAENLKKAADLMDKVKESEFYDEYFCYDYHHLIEDTDYFKIKEAAESGNPVAKYLMALDTFFAEDFDKLTAKKLFRESAEGGFTWANYWLFSLTYETSKTEAEGYLKLFFKNPDDVVNFLDSTYSELYSLEEADGAMINAANNGSALAQTLCGILSVFLGEDEEAYEYYQSAMKQRCSEAFYFFGKDFENADAAEIAKSAHYPN